MADTKHTAEAIWDPDIAGLAIEISNQYVRWARKSEQGEETFEDTKLRIIRAMISQHTTAEVARLEAEKAELVEACQFFISALGTGLLVRDISKDGESDWALKMLDFARELEKAHAALSKHTPVSEQGAEQTNPKPEV